MTIIDGVAIGLATILLCAAIYAMVEIALAARAARRAAERAEELIVRVIRDGAVNYHATWHVESSPRAAGVPSARYLRRYEA